MGLSHTDRAKRRQLIAAHAAKHGPQAAANEYGVGMATVRVACLEFGVAVPRIRRESGLSSFGILKALLDGIPQSQIAVEFGLTRQRVHQVKQKAIKAGFKIPK